MTTNVKPINKCEKCGCEILDGDRLCIHCYKKRVIITSIIFSTLWISTAVITSILFETAITFGIWWFWFILFPFFVKKERYINKRKMYFSVPVTLEELAPKLRHNPEVLAGYRKKYKSEDPTEFNAKLFAVYVQYHIYKDLNRCKSNILADHPTYMTFVRGSLDNSTKSTDNIFESESTEPVYVVQETTSQSLKTTKIKSHANEQTNSNKSLKIVTAILSICLVGLLCVSVYLNDQYIDISTYYHNLETAYKELETETSDLKDKLEKSTHLNTITDSLNACFIDNEADRTHQLFGKQYHNSSNPCSLFQVTIHHLELEDSVTYCTVYYAETQGRTPCRYCYKD